MLVSSIWFFINVSRKTIYYTTTQKSFVMPMFLLLSTCGCYKFIFQLTARHGRKYLYNTQQSLRFLFSFSLRRSSFRYLALTKQACAKFARNVLPNVFHYSLLGAYPFCSNLKVVFILACFFSDFIERMIWILVYVLFRVSYWWVYE